MARSRAVAEALGRAGDQLDGDALDGHAERPAVVLLDQGDDLRQLGEAGEDGARVLHGADDGEVLARVAPAANVASGLGVERGGDGVHELAGAVEQEPLARAALGFLRQGLAQLGLGLGADAGHGAEAAFGGGLAQLFGGADAEGARDLDRAPRAEPEVAAEADEVGGELALELGELGDLAGVDELAQARLDAGADAAQVAHAPGLDELGHRGRHVANRLGGAPVGAGGVGVGLGKLKQRREGVQAVGDLRVVHRPQSPPPAPATSARSCGAGSRGRARPIGAGSQIAMAR